MYRLNLSQAFGRSKSADVIPTTDNRHRRLKNAARYGVWLALAYTANANRRHFGLATTWVPHLVGNSVALFLPELLGLFDRMFRLADRLPPERYPTAAALRRTAQDVVVDNPDYVGYVAPAALAYVVSHPQFNIYRGSWGEKSFLGFGYDSIPHSTTAFALSNLAYDTIAAAARHTPPRALIYPPVKAVAARRTLVVAAFLAGLTLFYEMSEYIIYRSELEARDHDISQINMMWSVKDTVFDVLSNTIGWALAVLRRMR